MKKRMDFLVGKKSEKKSRDKGGDTVGKGRKRFSRFMQAPRKRMLVDRQGNKWRSGG